MARKNTAGGTIREVNDKDATEQTLQTVSADPPATAPGAIQAPAAKPPVDLTKLRVEKSWSRGLAGGLAANKISLAISSYQSGRLYLVGSDPQGRVSFFERIFDSPTIVALRR